MSVVQIEPSSAAASRLDEAEDAVQKYANMEMKSCSGTHLLLRHVACHCCQGGISQATSASYVQSLGRQDEKEKSIRKWILDSLGFAAMLNRQEEARHPLGSYLSVRDCFLSHQKHLAIDVPFNLLTRQVSLPSF